MGKKGVLLINVGTPDEPTVKSVRNYLREFLLDPDVIVCGGGMSDIEELYEEVPKRIIPYIASNFFNTPILKSKHGSSSGVRGAALLWD